MWSSRVFFPPNCGFFHADFFLLVFVDFLFFFLICGFFLLVFLLVLDEFWSQWWGCGYAVVFMTLIMAGGGYCCGCGCNCLNHILFCYIEY